MRFFKLPDLGEGLQEAEIVEWHVKPGDSVALDQLLVSVETAKAIVDIPAPQAGQLAQVFGATGDLLHIGDSLIEYANEQDTATVVGNLSAASTEDNNEEEDFFIIGSPTEHTPKTSHGNPIHPTTESTRASMSSSSTDTIELRGARRAMAKAMQNAQQQVAQVTLCEDADIQHWAPHTDTTARLCRAIACGVAAEPYFNAWFDEINMTLTLQPSVDLGIAVDSPHGLFVPVLRNVDELTPIEIRAAINELREGIETRSTPAQTLQGATFTLSNFGSLVANKAQPTLPKRLAGRYATPMVVPPCVAILGAGGARPTPVAALGEVGSTDDEQPAYSVEVHRLLPLSLSFDHRVLSGGEAERFLAACITDLELAI